MRHLQKNKTKKIPATNIIMSGEILNMNKCFLPNVGNKTRLFTLPSVLDIIWEVGVTKKHGETFKSDGHVHCLNSGDGFMGIYKYVKIYQIVLKKKKLKNAKQ